MPLRASFRLHAPGREKVDRPHAHALRVGQAREFQHLFSGEVKRIVLVGRQRGLETGGGEGGELLPVGLIGQRQDEPALAGDAQK